MVVKGEGWWEGWIEGLGLAKSYSCIRNEWMINRDLLYSTGESQYSVIICMEMDVCVCVCVCVCVLLNNLVYRRS